MNTAIAQMMIFVNEATAAATLPRDTVTDFLRLLAPFAPHLAEEIWQLYGNTGSLAYEPWPEVNEEFLREDTLEYPVSFNGKLRYKIILPVSASASEVESAVLRDERSEKWLAGEKPKKVIVVPGRIVNIVV